MEGDESGAGYVFSKLMRAASRSRSICRYDASGLDKEGSKHGIEDFLEKKLVSIRFRKE